MPSPCDENCRSKVLIKADPSGQLFYLPIDQRQRLRLPYGGSMEAREHSDRLHLHLPNIVFEIVLFWYRNVLL